MAAYFHDAGEVAAIHKQAMKGCAVRTRNRGFILAQCHGIAAPLFPVQRISSASTPIAGRRPWRARRSWRRFVRLGLQSNRLVWKRSDASPRVL